MTWCGIGVPWREGLTERVNPSVASLYGICYGNNQFVAGGMYEVGSAGAVILTSPDGITWTKRLHTGHAYTQISNIAWNGSIYCAVGGADGYAPTILTSPDGITWTKQTSPLGNTNLDDIVWNGSIFCAIGGGNIITSGDGIT